MQYLQQAGVQQAQLVIGHWRDQTDGDFVFLQVRMEYVGGFVVDNFRFVGLFVLVGMSCSFLS